MKYAARNDLIFVGKRVADKTVELHQLAELAYEKLVISEIINSNQIKFAYLSTLHMACDIVFLSIIRANGNQPLVVVIFLSSYFNKLVKKNIHTLTHAQTNRVYVLHIQSD